MNLIESLKAKAEADRVRAEAELPALAERVAHGEATEKEVTAWLKASEKSLDDLQTAVDRQKRIDELRGLTQLFRERRIAHHRAEHELKAHVLFRAATTRELEAAETKLRVSAWVAGNAASESQEAFRTLNQLTGEPYAVPSMRDEFAAVDAEFSKTPLPPIRGPVVTEAELPPV